MKKLLSGIVMSIMLLGVWVGSTHAQSSFCDSGDPTVPVEECQALVALYTYTNGNNWINQSGWIDSYDISTWYGVTVEDRNGTDHVVGLSLGSNNLVGVVPADIKELSFVEEIFVEDNSITVLPEELGTLTNLTILDIRDLLLTMLPDGIGSLDSLTILKVDNNQISNLPSTIGSLSELDYFSISFNAISSLPLGFDELDELDYLDLSNNNFSVFPDFGDGLLDLDIVNFSSNNITELPFSLNTLGGVKSLDFGYNDITTIDSTITGFGGLEKLVLSDNELTILPDWVGDLSSLVSLYVDHNQLTELPDFSLLTNLYTLYANNNVLENFSDALGGLSGLRYLYLQDNAILGTIPSSYSGLTGLRRFHCNNNALDRLVDHTAVIPTEVTSRYESVLVKDISNQRDETAPTISLSSFDNVFTQEGTITLSVIIDENSYAVDGNSTPMEGTITGPGLCSTMSIDPLSVNEGTVFLTATMPSLGGYSECLLSYTDHGGNQSNSILLDPLLYGTTWSDFCDLSTISIPRSECLGLVGLYESLGGENRTNNTNWFMTPVIDDWFGVKTEMVGGSTHVTGLYLHKNEGDDGYGISSLWEGNNLVGTIPESIGTLSYLTQLNLSNNTLSGVLPDAIGTLGVLEDVYLGSNQLTGGIPASREGLGSINRIILQNNQLSGSLPSLFGMFSSLEILDLHGNNFSGTIPEGWDALSQIWYLDLSHNEISGEIPTYLGSFNVLKYLNLAGNRFSGTIPTELVGLSGLETLFLQNNILNRTSDHNAILPSSMEVWYASLDTVGIGGQGDETPPIISGTGTVSWLVEDTFEWTLTVDENSYAVNPYNQGMSVLFSGGSLCEQLTTQLVTINQGSVVLTIQTADYGLYEGCELSLQDHGYNVSESHILPTFGKAKNNHEVCYNPDLTISLEQCLGLVEFYEESGGDERTVRSGWLSSENVGGWEGITTELVDGVEVVTEILLPNNNLVGTVSLGDVFSSVRNIDLSTNNLDLLTIDWGSMDSLSELNLSNNDLEGLLPDGMSDLGSLRILDLSSNQYSGGLPTSWSELSLLEELLLHNNKLGGTLSSWLGGLLSLSTIDFSSNEFIGNIPEERIDSSSIDSLLLGSNKLNRAIDHTILTQGNITVWVEGLGTYDGSNQSDDTAPELYWVEEFPTEVSGVITTTLSVYEGSYVLDDSGGGMDFVFTGTGLCDSLKLLEKITFNAGTGIVSIIPEGYGTYNGCILGITDHGGNTGWIDIPSFDYSVSCGNGIIEGTEDCDEGRFCSDGSSCTNDISRCPFECKTRFKEGCNPLCKESGCGDGFVDINGSDTIPQTGDDEQCDEGRFCNNGVACTNDPSICALGEVECLPRFTQTCTPYCSLSTCGDGFVDRDGIDNEFDTIDDEMCDDGNHINGDGCNSLCNIEGCGDAYLDPDGIDNDPLTILDNEQCDLGANNGLLGSNCDSTCSIPGENCVFCYETCDGGDGDHSLFLLIDVSGSMGTNNKLEKAIAGATAFVDLVEERATTNTDFTTKIGIIAFESHAWIAQTPTTNYDDVRTAISGLIAGGGTNMGDALDDVEGYFSNNDLGFEQHVILLSDGLPTSGGGYSYTPTEWAIHNADQLKDDGISIYTISVELSTEGVDLMRKVSSSPIHNISYDKITSQSSTKSSRHAYKAVDGNLSNRKRSQTKSNENARWEIDLGALYDLKEIRLWNRSGNNARRTSDYYILMSEDEFDSTTLSTTLTEPGVSNIYEPGTAHRPSLYSDIDTIVRHLRVQLAGTNSLGLAEVEILGCPNGTFCEDVYNYEDYQGDAIDLLYSHIFGAIHCNCKPEKLCGVCGDGWAQDIYGESCDEGSICPDLTDCTDDPGRCPGECFPKQTTECTGTCQYSSCGDGTIQSPNHDGIAEQCDDGNTESGDGCTGACIAEFCGDGFTDSNGPDNIWFTSDDESCDPNDPGIAEGCLLDCTRDPEYLSQDGICSGESFIYNVRGDGTNGPDVNTLCSIGDATAFFYDENLHKRTWYCLGIYGGNTVECTVPERYCGDGYVQQTTIQEECEDGNQQSGDGCNDVCLTELPLRVPSLNNGRCLSIQKPVIQQGEYLPIGWDLIPVDDIDLDATSCNDLNPGKYIAGSSMMCHFSLYRGTPSGPVLIKTLNPINCIGSTNLEGAGEFVNDFFQDYGATRMLGQTLFNEQRNTIHANKGRYFIALDSIEYTFCGVDDTGNDRSNELLWEGDDLCHYEYSVTAPYLTQQGTTFGSIVAGAISDDYTNIEGEGLFAEGVVEIVDHKEVVGYNNEIIKYLSQNFVEKYRGGAIIPVFPFGSNKAMKKVPTKSVYFYVGTGPGSSVTISDKLLLEEDVYTLIVINADLIIEGSLGGNGLHIVLGGKTFFIPKTCDINDYVTGIFLSERGFESPLLHNTVLDASQRCKGGGLVIDGLLLGPDSKQGLLQKRRSHLDLLTDFTHIPEAEWNQLPELQKTTIKNDQSKNLIDGSAVRIKANTNNWNSLPAGATELFDAVEIYR